MAFKSKNSLTNTLLRFENFLSTGEELGEEETKTLLLNTISQKIEEILYPLKYTSWYQSNGGVFLNKGYLRQMIRPSGDDLGRGTEDVDEARLDGRICMFAYNFLEKYLQTGSSDYKGYDDPPITNICREVIMNKITSFFNLKLWNDHRLNSEEAKRHICNRFGTFFRVWNGFVVHDSFF